MHFLISKIFFYFLCSILLQACSTKYIEQKKIGTKNKNFNNPLQSKVYFKLSDNFKANKPSCIIVLPTKSKINSNEFIVGPDNMQFDKIIRKSIYAHLSALNYRDIELSRIDYIIKKNNYYTHNEYLTLASDLSCDGVLEIEISRFNYSYLGLYSSINVDIAVKLFSSSSKEILWEAFLQEKKAKGDIPLSPFSIAAGLYSATNNLKEENIYAVSDNIARKLLKKLPDTKFQLINDSLKIADNTEYKNNFSKKNNLYIKIKDHKNFQSYIKENRFDFEGFEKLYKEINKNKGLNDISTYSYSRLLFKNGYYEKVISTITDYRLSKKLSSELNFLLGQTYFNKLDFTRAEESIIKAIAKKPKKASYYNVLGVVYIKQNKIALANASFSKALNIAPDDIRANKIIGVINFNQENYEEAAFHFANAAISSFENADYENLAENIIYLEKIKKINSKIINEKIMKKLYIALKGRKKNEL